MDKLDSILAKSGAPKAGPNKGQSLVPISAKAWEEAVGSRIARRAMPLSLRRGVLYLMVSSAAWANELALLEADIRDQLRHRGHDVDSLRFRVGDIDRRRREHGPREPLKGAPRSARLPPELERQVAKVEDPDLREALTAAAARSLTTKRS